MTKISSQPTSQMPIPRSSFENIGTALLKVDKSEPTSQMPIPRSSFENIGKALLKADNIEVENTNNSSVKCCIIS